MVDYTLTGPGNVENVKTTLPDENQLFYQDVGEGAQSLSLIKDGTLYNLGFAAPQNFDWAGRTIGYYVGQNNEQAVNQLGLSGLQTVNQGDFGQYLQSSGLKSQSINDVNQFLQLAQGASIFGGSSVTRSPNTSSPFYDPNNPSTPNFSSVAGYGTNTAYTDSLNQPITTQNFSSGGGTMGGTDPVYLQNALNLVYSQRGDLQELYNLDGTAKNPNDPRVAGIPTLKDWAQKYGFKETSILQGFAPQTQPTITTMNAEQIANPPQSVNLTQTNNQLATAINASSNTADSVAASALQYSKTLEQTIQELTVPAGPEEQKLQSMISDVNNLLPGLANKATDQLAAEQAAGIPQLKQSLSAINAQILAGQAEYNQLKQSYDELSLDNRNRAITMNSIIGNEAQIDFARKMALNRKASDLGLLQAQALGLQGQITAAQDSVNRAIDLKYSALETQIEIKQQQIQLIQPLLDKEERILANAQSLYLQRQQQAIAERKAIETQISNLMLDAAQAGADSETLARIQKSTTLNQAIMASASFFQQQKLEAKQSTIAKNLGVSYPFFKYPGNDTVFSSTTGQPVNYAQYQAQGGIGQIGQGAFPDVQEIGGTTSMEWSDPYLLGGDYVQKNQKTGQIRMAVNVPIGDSDSSKYSKVSSGLGFEYQLNGEPITLAQYIKESGKSLFSALSGSKDPGDLELLDLINIGINANSSEARQAAQEAEAAIRQGVNKLDVIAALKKTYDSLIK